MGQVITQKTPGLVFSLAVGLALLCGCRVGDGGTAQAPTPADGPQIGETREARPPGQRPQGDGAKAGFSLRDLRQYTRDGGKNEDECLQGLVGLLHRELSAPREPAMGVGGGPIDHGYVVGVLVGVISENCGAKSLRAACERERDPQVRHLLLIPRVAAGDTSAANEVRDMALRNAEGAVRLSAMRALGRMKDAANRQTFEAGLRDGFCRLASPGVTRAKWSKIYPVRLEAVESLASLGLPRPTTVTDVPLAATEPAALFAELLSDKDASSCLSAVKLLVGEGQAGLPYLKAFVRLNATDSALAESVALAREQLEQ